MDDPKQLINRFVEELWNERRLDVADAIFAKDCVTHQLRSGMPVDAVLRGLEVIKEHVAEWIASVPDLRFSKVKEVVMKGRLIYGGTVTAEAWIIKQNYFERPTPDDEGRTPDYPPRDESGMFYYAG